MKQEIVYEKLSFLIVGLLFEVHNELGRYCNEKQCGDRLEQLLKERGIFFEREKTIPPSFDGEKNGRNKIDFLIEDKIVLELKCVRNIDRDAYYKCLRYLKAINKKLAIIVNFRDKHLKPKRVLNPECKTSE